MRRETLLVPIGLLSTFNGRVERAVKVGDYDGIVPSIAGWARQTGLNTIYIDDRDPFAHGFSLV